MCFPVITLACLYWLISVSLLWELHKIITKNFHYPLVACQMGGIMYFAIIKSVLMRVYCDSSSIGVKNQTVSVSFLTKTLSKLLRKPVPF